MDCLDPYIECMLVISTSHITPKEAEKLNNGEESPFITYDKEEYGWLLFIEKDRTEYDAEWPSLSAIHTMAAQRGLQWVMFDRGAELCKALPHYEW